MTAEVAILNCSGLAMAADSAVTVGSQKIYNSAMKLFALSKIAPVAIMVYGTATLTRVPWEIVIKEYRRHLGANTYPKLTDYAGDFCKFIAATPHLFDTGTERAWLEERINGILGGVFKEATNRCEKELESNNGAGLTPAQVKKIFAKTVTDHLTALRSWEDLKPTEKVLSRLNKSCEKIVKNIGPRVFGDIYNQVSKDLIEVAQQFFRRSYFPEPSSGIVIGGYGQGEIFPSVVTLEFDGAISGLARFKINNQRTQSITAGENPAAIIAYAQEDMVATFMEGINPAVKTFVEGCLESAFKALPDALLSSVKIENQKLKTELVGVCENVRKKLSQAAENYRMREHVLPVLNMVNALPKDELAAMAESLVNLTAFKRRVTGTLETVGGPIDVCVVSKGDGLVWVKRKHYFPSELNLHFQQNYLREVGS